MTVLSRIRPGRVRPFQTGRDLRLGRLPLDKPGAHDNRLDDKHDLVAVGVVRAKLGALAGVESALEQRAQDRRVDFRPVEVRRREHRFDLDFFRDSAESSSNSPPSNQATSSKPIRPPVAIAPNRVAGKLAEDRRLPPCLVQHPREHAVRQQADVLREHAEHQPVDEMRDRLRIVAPLPQSLRQRGEGRRRAFGQRLPRLAGPQALRVRERPFELVAHRRVREIVQPKLVYPADAVRPVRMDAEPQHVRDDQQRRVLQRQRVLPELREGGVQIGPLALVLPGEVMALPDVRPAVAAGVLARAALEAVMLAGRVGFGGGWLAQQPAQVDEVFLRRRALLQLRRAPTWR